MNGKGDKMRPFNGKTYRDNFDRIFRKKRKSRAELTLNAETFENGLPKWLLKKSTKPTP